MCFLVHLFSIKYIPTAALQKMTRMPSSTLGQNLANFYLDCWMISVSLEVE